MKTYICLMIFLLAPALRGQNTASLENQRSELLHKIQLQEKTVNALQTQLDSATSRIEKEKSAHGENSGKITKLLAGAFSLSNKVEEEKQRKSALEQELQETNQKLDIRYTEIIDSMQALKKSRKAGQQSDMDRQILETVEKKLSVSPQIEGLSFNPGQIAGIHLREARDSTEYAIYRDYLKNALADVTQHQTRIEKLEKELEEVALLKKKSEEFLEEAGAERDMGLFAQTVSPIATAEPTYGQISTDAARQATGAQVQSLFLIMRQLDNGAEDMSRARWKSPLDSGDVVLSIPDYLKLLKKTNAILEQQKLLLLHKLGEGDK
ncbi:MAG: hypothetical protein P8184_08785 [Calditrichia bacterium]